MTDSLVVFSSMVDFETIFIYLLRPPIVDWKALGSFISGYHRIDASGS